MELQKITFDAATENYRSNELDRIRLWASNQNVPFTTPVFVEIGCNRGRFLRDTALLYPEASLLGLDWQHKWAKLAVQTLAKASITNARVLSADAKLALPLLFPNNALKRVYVLFPDPWWKRRHSKRRLLTPAFLQLLAAKIAEGGHLIIKTDVEPYAEYITTLVEGVAQYRLVLPGDSDYPSREKDWPKTTREYKIVEQNLPFWKFYLCRTDVPALPPDEQETPEPERFPKPDVELGNSRS